MALLKRLLDNLKSKLEIEGNSSRRDALKALSTIPVLGLFAYASHAHSRSKSLERKRNSIQQSINTDSFHIPRVDSSQTINVGVVGFGLRGEQLCRGLGYAHPDWLSQEKAFDPDNWRSFVEQDDLNINLVGVCDLFDERADRGIATASTGKGHQASAQAAKSVKRFKCYRNMLDSKDVDAVIIATPDFWHYQMAVDAIDAGKHIYSEKCMTHTLEQALDLHERLERSDVVYQLGHQNRQQISFHVAREIVQANLLGDVSLVELSTNRNSARGAWVLPIPSSASPQTVDWQQFQQILPRKTDFNPEHFFRWRCWYNYSTGIAGDLLSHDFDTINQIMGLGIPESVFASGGIYHYKDGRDTPDTFQVSLEYPKRELAVHYSATLSNGRERGKLIMGSAASMKIGSSIDVYPESNSDLRKGKHTNGSTSDKPYFRYSQGAQVDAVSGASEKYFASRGLINSYVDGRKYDVTHLHLRDWLDCIRTGRKPMCNYEQALQEAVTCHMATASYLEGRKVSWKSTTRTLV